MCSRRAGRESSAIAPQLCQKWRLSATHFWTFSNSSSFRNPSQKSGTVGLVEMMLGLMMRRCQRRFSCWQFAFTPLNCPSAICVLMAPCRF